MDHTHEFLIFLKDHFISKDKCHDRDGILQFQNQVNYIFLKWKEDIFLFHYKNKKVVKVDFKEFIQGDPYVFQCVDCFASKTLAIDVI